MMRDSKIEVLCTYLGKIISQYASYQNYRKNSDAKNAGICKKSALSWINNIFREIAPERKMEKRFPRIYHMIGELRHSLENGL